METEDPNRFSPVRLSERLIYIIELERVTVSLESFPSNRFPEMDKSLTIPVFR
jgi:hypothetical protein